MEALIDAGDIRPFDFGELFVSQQWHGVSNEHFVYPCPSPPSQLQIMLRESFDIDVEPEFNLLAATFPALCYRILPFSTCLARRRARSRASCTVQGDRWWPMV